MNRSLLKENYPPMPADPGQRQAIYMRRVLHSSGNFLAPIGSTMQPSPPQGQNTNGKRFVENQMDQADGRTSPARPKTSHGQRYAARPPPGPAPTGGRRAYRAATPQGHPVHKPATKPASKAIASKAPAPSVVPTPPTAAKPALRRQNPAPAPSVVPTPPTAAKPALRRQNPAPAPSVVPTPPTAAKPALRRQNPHIKQRKNSASNSKAVTRTAAKVATSQVKSEKLMPTVETNMEQRGLHAKEAVHIVTLEKTESGNAISPDIPISCKKPKMIDASVQVAEDGPASYGRTSAAPAAEQMDGITSSAIYAVENENGNISKALETAPVQYSPVPPPQHLGRTVQYSPVPPPQRLGRTVQYSPVPPQQHKGHGVQYSPVPPPQQVGPAGGVYFDSAYRQMRQKSQINLDFINRPPTPKLRTFSVLQLPRNEKTLNRPKMRNNCLPNYVPAAPSQLGEDGNDQDQIFMRRTKARFPPVRKPTNKRTD